MSCDFNSETIKELIKFELRNYYEDYRDNYECEYSEDTEAYGDTYVGTGQYMSEEVENQCVEDFQDSLDVDDFIFDRIKENTDFRNIIINMVENGEF